MSWPLTFGSSPHTRGARPGGRRPGSWRRIIPAYAGSTFGSVVRRAWPRDHPRIRGEHDGRSVGEAARPGSSPHTRGAHPVGFVGGGRVGIIPAYAGSTLLRASEAPTSRDHPRIRGEHKDEEKTASIEGGSSPHTRGARRGSRSPSADTGIIPAYAGSTASSHFADSTCWDHPRIRGEHQRMPHEKDALLGSSPHTRGARQGSRRAPAQTRIIPAYAGSTTARGICA